MIYYKGGDSLGMDKIILLSAPRPASGWMEDEGDEFWELDGMEWSGEYPPPPPGEDGDTWK